MDIEKQERMSRKRFIGLLMAGGFSRNTAHSAARLVQRVGASYADVYRRYLIALVITCPYDLCEIEALAYSITP